MNGGGLLVTGASGDAIAVKELVRKMGAEGRRAIGKRETPRENSQESGIPACFRVVESGVLKKRGGGGDRGWSGNKALGRGFAGQTCQTDTAQETFRSNAGKGRGSHIRECKEND
jgi:hypothetical protein